MQITSHTTEKIQGSHVIKEGVGFTVLEITMRMYITHSKSHEARMLVYSEALTAGCGTYTRDAFIDALALLGSQITVRAQTDTIHISLRSRNENLKKTLALLTLLIQKPTFAPKELLRIKTHIQNALTLAKEDARPRARDAFINALVHEKDARYSFPIDAIKTEVSRVTKDEIRELHTRVTEAVIEYTCGGDTASCALVATVLKTLDLPKVIKKSETQILSLVPSTKPFVSCIDIPHKQNIEFSIGASMPILSTDEEYPAFLFGISVLGIRGGFSGRLMSTVREKEGLTYMIYANIEEVSATQHGFWRIGTFFSPKDTAEGLIATIREITKIHEKGITEDELKRFKAILKTRFILVNDSLIKKVSEVHAYTTAGMHHTDFEAIQKRIASMTVREVNMALKKYLTPKTLTISGAGPTKNVAGTIKKIVALR